MGAVQDGDAVVTFNFRADRMVEMSKALEYTDFKHFDRKRFPNIRFAGMMQASGSGVGWERWEARECGAGKLAWE